jgi:hypothetical protein
VDFLRLALREAKRNATKTQIAILAVALAAAVPILARMIPQGYAIGYGMVERQFAGGDVLVWTAAAPVDSRSDSYLAWLPWDGRDWQSDALYFLPSLESKGYLAETPASEWRPTSASEVARLLEGVPGVAEVRPYLALPCMVESPEGPFPAVLRGRGPETLSPLSMGELVKAGRALKTADSGEYNALVPLQGNAIWKPSNVDQGVRFEIAVPRLAGVEQGKTFGVSWDNPVKVELVPVGGYEAQVDEIVDLTGPRVGTPDAIRYLPVFWERPEIVVTEETFRMIAARASGGVVPSPDSFPVYQVAVRVERMSYLKKEIAAIRAALGRGFAAYSMPELQGFKDSESGVPVISRDLWPVFLAMIFGLSGVIVTGSVYIMLAQQRRKIGLLRVVGARRWDIVVYALGVTLYVTLTGAAAGFLAGKLLSLVALPGSDLSIREWLLRSGSEFLTVFGLSLSVTAALGLAVGFWASRIPCAEVLRRG